jgi:hypothetical protein
MKVTVSKTNPTLSHVYLFNDQVVITKRVHRKSGAKPTATTKQNAVAKSERFKTQLFFKNLVLREQVEESKNAFVLVNNDGEQTTETDSSYTFYCTNSGSKIQWIEDLKRLLTEKDKLSEKEKDKENVIPDSANGRNLQKKKSQVQMKLKAPGELLRQASKKDLFSSLSMISSPGREEVVQGNKELTEISQNRKLIRRVETCNEGSRLSRKASRPTVTFKEERPALNKDKSRLKLSVSAHEKEDRGTERSFEKSSERTLDFLSDRSKEKEARRDKETARKKDLEASRALALKKMQETQVKTEDVAPIVNVTDEECSDNETGNLKDKDKKQSKRAKLVKRVSRRDKLCISPKGKEDPESRKLLDQPVSPRDNGNPLKKTRSIRRLELFFNENRRPGESAPEIADVQETKK